MRVCTGSYVFLQVFPCFYGFRKSHGDAEAFLGYTGDTEGTGFCGFLRVFAGFCGLHESHGDAEAFQEVTWRRGGTEAFRVVTWRRGGTGALGHHWHPLHRCWPHTLPQGTKQHPHGHYGLQVPSFRFLHVFTGFFRVEYKLYK